MFPRYKVLLLCLLMPAFTGCASMKKMEVPVPIVSDTETLKEIESKKAEAMAGDPRDRLKNMSAEEHVAKGNVALRRNDLGVARLHFTLAVTKDNTLTSGYIGMAEALMREKRFQEAKFVLEGIPNVGENKNALAKLGIACRNLRQYREAIDHLTKAYKMDAENGWLATELAIAYEQDGQIEMGGEFFKEASELLPNSTAAMNNLGFNYILQGKHQEAIPVLEKALDISPENAIAMNNLALAYAFEGEANKALNLFEESVGKAGAYNNLGYILMLKDQDANARLALSRAVELNPKFYARANKNLEILKSANSDRPENFE